MVASTRSGNWVARRKGATSAWWKAKLTRYGAGCQKPKALFFAEPDALGLSRKQGELNTPKISCLVKMNQNSQQALHKFVVSMRMITYLGRYG